MYLPLKNKKPVSPPARFAWSLVSQKPLFIIGRLNTGDLEISDVKKMKSLNDENTRLKEMYADLNMDNQILKDLFTKKGWALPQKGN